MFSMIAIVLLAGGAGLHVLFFVAARWLVTRRVPERSRRISYGFIARRSAAGLAGWYLASALLLTAALLGVGDVVVDDRSMRVTVGVDGPAARAGIETGDRIVAIAGTPITSWDQMRSVVTGSDGGPLAIEIDRRGELRTVTATPTGSPARLLVGPHTETRSMGLGKAVVGGVTRPAEIVAMTFKALTAIVLGTEKPEVSGPREIVHETARSAQTGIASALLLVAAICAYVWPLVAFGTAVYELLNRRHERLRRA